MQHDQSDITEKTGSQLQQIVRDFRDYLSRKQQQGVIRIPLGQASEKWLSGTHTSENRLQPIKCTGPVNAQIMIIDSEGGFFNGEPGQLLVKIIKAMNLEPENVFMCAAAGFNTLRQKIAQVSPKVVIILGEKASCSLLKTDQNFEMIRGRFHEFESTSIMPTYHPSLLIKDPGFKRHVWEDMKQVMAFAGLAANGS